MVLIPRNTVASAQRTTIATMISLSKGGHHPFGVNGKNPNGFNKHMDEELTLEEQAAAYAAFLIEHELPF